MDDPLIKEKKFITRSPHCFPSSSSSPPPLGIVQSLPPSARFSLIFENSAFDDDYVVTDEPAFRKETIYSTCSGDGRAVKEFLDASLQKNGRVSVSDAEELTEKCSSNGSHGTLDFLGSSDSSLQENVTTGKNAGLNVQMRNHWSTDKMILNTDHAGKMKKECHETSGSTPADELVDERECRKLPLSSRNLVVLLHHALRHGLKFSLRGMALGDVLTQPVKSTRFFLTSSKLTNLFNYEERSSWPLKMKETHADKSKQKLSVQPAPFIQQELPVKQKGISSESDMSIKSSLLVDNLQCESNMNQQVVSDHSTQALSKGDSIPKATTRELYCRGLGMDSSKDTTVQPASALSADKRTFNAHSVGQNQEDEVHLNGNLSSAPPEFGDDSRSGDLSTNMSKKSPMLLVESMSPRDFPTNCCCSIDRVAPLGCKQKIMSSFPHLHKNQYPYECEEHIMLAKGSMASWPSSESHCCFSPHVPHFPHRWTKNPLSEQPNQWSKSFIPCHYCHEQFHHSSSVCQFQNDCRGQSGLCQSPGHYENCQNPSEVYHRPASSVYQHTLNCGGQHSNIMPKKLLWVSEEEAEIIRLIRLSQEISRCSSSNNTSRQDSPILNAKAGPELPEDINLCDARGAPQSLSRFSSSSVEDFGVKIIEDVAVSMCDMDIKPTLGGGDEESISLKSLPDFHDQINLQKIAASCIQLYWRKCLKRKEEESKERKRLEALKFVSEMPTGHDSLMQMAITAIRSGELVSWYSSMHMAAKVIQRAWRKTLKQMHGEVFVLESIPWGMKKLYEFIVRRHKSKGHTVPSYEIFTGRMERLQAVIEGARIRRRLKTRRLQTIVKEIKEIRLLVQEISNEPASESFPNLLPQLSIQLQQKMMQLQTALSGPQDAARVVLRRCPATPLVIGSSKNTQIKSSALTSPTIINAEISGNSSVKSSIEKFSSSQKKKRQVTAESTNINLRAKGSMEIHELVPDVDLRSSFSSSQKMALPSQEENLRKQLVVRKERNEKAKDRNPEERKEKLPKQQQIVISPTTINTRSPSKNNMIRKTEQVIQLWQKEPVLVHDVPLEEPEGVAVHDSDFEDISQNQDIPKHPFLRRKSKAMPPQKLDWSKVKPMVSSRLEPELKTRLFKPNFRGAASLRKKRNFTNIKSRLFSYEKTVDEASGLVKSSEFKHDGENTDAMQRKLVTDYDSKDVKVSINKSSNMEILKQPSLRYSQKQLEKKDSVKILESEPQPYFSVISLEKIEKKQEEDSRFPSAPLDEEKSLNCGYAENKMTQQPAMDSQVERTSSELEKMFDRVIRGKDGQANSLASFFSSNQQDSIVPRLHPSSCLFKLTRAEMSRIHKVLSKEGCAGRLQHKCLSFVSIRD